MVIVLFRHGEAEDRADLRDDGLRSLTAKGRKRTKKMAKIVNKLLPRKCKIQIWSSPLLRALQTAEILAEQVGVKVKIHNAISNGDFETLRANLTVCHEDDCILIVGHQPFLGEWTEQLTGMQLPFRKSTAAGVRFLTGTQVNSRTEAELLWYIQPRFSKG
ncbi:phosphohistidine phosphatase SixA [Anaerospora hongkongensis]|uniref:Phosphohistidine phosphatase SixA n=1 Tax=Anaerospora hongkongensis TaxID=244830 RepID=A0A4V2Q903_9FIRM|nr:phosphohistidine phosphatase SixA [Anaerospora hongkongensis]TCL39444.1 phosphohistidine phosphatase SixA [Anaerospora hongkongensis]